MAFPSLFLPLLSALFFISFLSSTQQSRSPLQDADLLESFEWFEKTLHAIKKENVRYSRKAPKGPSPTLEQVGEQVKLLAERLISCRPVPSISFAIVNSTHSFASIVQSNLTYNYSTSTNYGIGSTSKAFTSFLASQLKDKNLLSFDSPVRDYITQFELVSAPGGSVWLTMEDLFTHRTGLPGHGYDSCWGFGTNYTRAELVSRFKFLQPSAQIRSKWQYSNIAIVAAGLACSNILSVVNKKINRLGTSCYR